jgi:hypothetical protein
LRGRYETKRNRGKTSGGVRFEIPPYAGFFWVRLWMDTAVDVGSLSRTEL